MKKLILFALAMALCCAGFAQANGKAVKGSAAERVERCIPPDGVPNKDLVHKGYICGYNQMTRMPNYVSYVLSKKEARAYDPERKVGYRFGNDPLYNGPRAMASDYSQEQRYVPAQLAPVEDMMWDETALQETFYMTNIAPMHKAVYDGLWYELEQKCRWWAKKYGDLYIATGPTNITGRKLPIQGSDIVAPDAYFKVLLQRRGDRWACVVFLFPNTMTANPELSGYMFSLASFLSLYPIDVFAGLDIDVSADPSVWTSYKESDWVIPDWKN